MAQQTATRPGLVRTILVPTDFSAASKVAVEWALHLAGLHKAQILLLHSTDTPTSPPNLPPLIERTVSAHVESRLQALAVMARNAGIAVTSEHHPGRPWEVIIETCRRASADLIVMGTRGHTDFARALLGSTTRHVIRSATVPVLTVHPGHGSPRPLNTVLAAIDFSAHATRAARVVADLMGSDGATPLRLVLLHVRYWINPYGVDDISGPVMQWMTETEDEIKRDLERIATGLRRPGVEVELRVCVGYPVDVIEREAKELGADCVTLGTHGRSGLGHLLLGSVAERTLHHVACPVLTVRAS